MDNNLNTQVHKTEVEQVAAVEATLSDPKKLILLGFALGLKAENPYIGATLPPTTGTQAAV